MVISRATTPTIEIKFPEAITTYDSILISFAQDNELIIDKVKTDLTLVSGTTYSITFTEDEINNFVDGLFECQVRVVRGDEVAASKIYRGRVVDVLNDEILGE